MNIHYIKHPFLTKNNNISNYSIVCYGGRNKSRKVLSTMKFISNFEGLIYSQDIPPLISGCIRNIEKEYNVYILPEIIQTITSFCGSISKTKNMDNIEPRYSFGGIRIILNNIPHIFIFGGAKSGPKNSDKFLCDCHIIPEI